MKEAALRQRTAELTALAQHLQTAREDERRLLAQDLHDELGALLTSAKLDVARIRARLGPEATPIHERLDHLGQTLNEVIALKRRIVDDLHPSALTHLGLVATLGILARELAEHSGLQVHSDLHPVALSPAAQLVVYRLVQEALTNLSQHAQAQQVWISLGPCGQRVEVRVRDDGVGFEPGAAGASSHGLLGMRCRVEAQRGQLWLRSAPGQGTELLASLPAEPAVSEGGVLGEGRDKDEGRGAGEQHPV